MKKNFTNLILIGIIISTVFITGCSSQISIAENQVAQALKAPCPDLADIKFDVLGKGNGLYYTKQFKDMMTPTGDSTAVKFNDYKQNGYEIQYNSFYGENIIDCQKGSENGDNTNYLYCGTPGQLKITHSDNQGAILQSYYAKIVINPETQKYVAIKCGI